MEKLTVRSIKRIEEAPKFVYNLEVAKNHNYFIEGILLHNSANIILDESSLIPDDIYAKIFRMLGGHEDNFILEIGNPFKRNHFLKSFRNPRYKKVIVDYKRAIEEGRLTTSFIDEMRERAHFDVLYGVKFPEEEDVDSSGWMRIFYESTIHAAKKKIQPPVFGERVMGVDVNRGGDNKSVIVQRWGNHAKVLQKFNSSNLNELAALIMKESRENGIAAENIYIDATGVGGGLVDIMEAKGWFINGVNMANKAVRDDKYINRRAEAYILSSEWLKKGNTLCDDPDWDQLEDIKAMVRDSSGKWQVISKQKLAEEGIPSPDIADAFMLTFCGGDLDEKEFFKNTKVLSKKRYARPTYE